MRDSVAITYNALSTLITSQAFFVGLDKNKSDLEKVAFIFGGDTQI